jgi:hypothetical protein
VQRIRATITYPFGGSPGVITLYTQTAIAEDSSTAQLCCDRLKNAIIAGADLFTTSTVFTSDTFVDKIDEATGAITDSTVITPWTQAGLQSNGELPPATMICATWNTGAIVNGRRVRGRTFLGPLDNSCLQNDGTLSSSSITHANALSSAWTDAGLTTTLSCVWHRPVGGTGGSNHEIISATIRDKFAVLRSRRD